jgi:hypothetical protein
MDAGGKNQSSAIAPATIAARTVPTLGDETGVG